MQFFVNYTSCQKYNFFATKKKGENYQSYLNSVKKNELARVVKLADLRHNSDLTRLAKVTEKDIERKEKYQKAIDFLNS